MGNHLLIPADGRIVEDAAAEAGSPDVSSATATFKDSDVGASVTLYTSTSYLLSRIVAIISAVAVTLADPVPETLTGARMHFGHDKSQVIQDAIAELDAGNGGVIEIDRYVMISRLLQDPTGRNCVIAVPNRNTGRMNQITLRGTGRPMIEDNGFLNYPPSLSGTVLFCPTPASGVEPSLFNGSRPTNGEVTCIDFRLENLTIRRAKGSMLSEFQFRNGGGLNFDRCVIGPDFGMMSEFLATPYPSLDHTSINFPNSNNGGSVNFKNGRIYGAGTAVKGAQHLLIDTTTIVASRHAIGFDAHGGGGKICVRKVHLPGNEVNFYAPVGIPIAEWSVDATTENYATGNLTNLWDFLDDSGTASCGLASICPLGVPPRSNTTNVTMITRGRDASVRNPQPIVLGGNQRLILRQETDDAFPGVEIQRPDGSVLGYLFAVGGENPQLILQACEGANISIRNAALQGIVVRPSGIVTHTGGVGVGNSLPATTPGAIIAKAEIFDSNGNSIGFLPILDSIT